MDVYHLKAKIAQLSMKSDGDMLKKFGVMLQNVLCIAGGVY